MSRSTEAVAWIGAGALLGILLSSVFSGLLQLKRNVFLVPYVVTVTVFLHAYVRWSAAGVWSLLRDRALSGCVGGVVFGAFVVSKVLSQPASAVPTGASLALALAWPGFTYGLVDALLLSVMPVLATGIALRDLELGGTVRSRVAVGAAAVLASSLVTAAYHLGYPEFRGAAVSGPLIGNALLTLSYVLTRSPLAPITGHIAMHIAAVIHGMETAMQLPPH